MSCPLCLLSGGGSQVLWLCCGAVVGSPSVGHVRSSWGVHLIQRGGGGGGFGLRTISSGDNFVRGGKCRHTSNFGAGLSDAGNFNTPNCRKLQPFLPSTQADKHFQRRPTSQSRAHGPGQTLPCSRPRGRWQRRVPLRSAHGALWVGGPGPRPSARSGGAGPPTA